MARERRTRRPRPANAAVQQLPWQELENPFPPIEILSADQLEAIHTASLDLLERTGLEFMGARAQDVLAKAGAEVDRSSGLVRFDRNLILELVAKAPSSITLWPRNPERAIRLGGKQVQFSLVAGPPNVYDRIEGRRSGNYADYVKLLRLAQSLNIIHLIGNQPVAPIELPAETRHLDCYLANVRETDLVFHLSAIGAERALDGIDIMALSRGETREDLIERPGVLTIISVNSPRRFDEAMSDGLMAMAEWGQPMAVTPFTLMGAMTPVTLAAALTQQNAEALAGIALAQATRPGTPVLYGAFTSNVDLRSGAPAFGTPENAKATIAAGQLARRYKLPYRSSNSSASNALDAQAAYESMMSLWGAIMGGANLVYHGAGWMEGGLTASFEKIVLDAELLQGMAETLQPIEVTADTLTMESLETVEPGGHFFGTPHTVEHYESAFYQPILSDWRNYESWLEAGAPEAAERATKVWQKLLEDYQAPDLPPDRLEAMEAFIARRKEEITAAAA